MKGFFALCLVSDNIFPVPMETLYEIIHSHPLLLLMLETTHQNPKDIHT